MWICGVYLCRNKIKTIMQNHNFTVTLSPAEYERLRLLAVEETRRRGKFCGMNSLIRKWIAESWLESETLKIEKL